MTLYVGDQLRLIREQTDNPDFAEDTATGKITEGISDDLIISYLNEAIQFIQSRIISVYDSAFIEEASQTVTEDDESYTINDNLFLSNKIVSVEYSRTGLAKDCYLLTPISVHQRTRQSGHPINYVRRNKEIILDPIPNNSSGKIFYNYYRQVDKLDKRRGQITSSSTTTIVIDDDTYYDELACERAQYLCIVDAYGTVKDYNVQVTSFNDTTRTFTIPTTTLVGTTGDFIVSGKYTSTHLHADMPDRAWDYARAYAQHRVYHKDSNMDSFNMRTEVKDILNDIIDSFSQMSDDVQDIPVLDSELQ